MVVCKFWTSFQQKIFHFNKKYMSQRLKCNLSNFCMYISKLNIIYFNLKTKIYLSGILFDKIEAFYSFNLSIFNICWFQLFRIQYFNKILWFSTLSKSLVWIPLITFWFFIMLNKRSEIHDFDCQIVILLCVHVNL